MINKYSTLKILVFIILLFGTNNSFSQENKTIASCCESEIGRCTGSSYCTACTNCSRCKHCNNGGSCGVCAGGSIKTKTYKKNKYYPSVNSRKSSKKQNFR